MKKEIKQNMFNGKGEIHFIHLLEDKQKNGMLRVYAQVTIPPMCSIGYHEHQGDSESYYILSGEGIYQDNDKKYIIKAGDHTFCKEGNGHGLENDGNDPLIMMALIIYNKQKV